MQVRKYILNEAWKISERDFKGSVVFFLSRGGRTSSSTSSLKSWAPVPTGFSAEALADTRAAELLRQKAKAERDEALRTNPLLARLSEVVSNAVREAAQKVAPPLSATVLASEGAWTKREAGQSDSSGPACSSTESPPLASAASSSEKQTSQTR